MACSYSILITNCVLSGYSGTEIVVRDLSMGLAKRGHRVGVYSPRHGALVEEIRNAGIPVVAELDELPFVPAIVHGHHHVETLMALERFPGARGIFVCHDRSAWTDLTPYHPRLGRYVAVDLNCRERLEQEGRISQDDIRVVANAVDLDRFLPRPKLPLHPRRALVFSNYAHSETHLDPILEACARMSLPVDVAGERAGKLATRPEVLLPEYDLVFAKARCACEAMATGCAVILCDFAGLGSLVTRDQVENYRDWNFGRRLLDRPIQADLIVREIERYDAGDAREVSHWIREHAGLGSALDQYEAIYEEVMRDPVLPRWTRCREYLAKGLQRISAIEKQIAELKNGPEMLPVTAAAAERIALTVEDSVSAISLKAGSAFELRVTLYNGSDVLLHSAGRNGVRLSYHWLFAKTGAVAIRDGLRADWNPAIAPGESRTFTLRGTAPDQPGDYLLQITLVQEHLCWLETIAPSLPRTVPARVE